MVVEADARAERAILRTCIGCRRVRDRRELVRLAVDPRQGLIVNPARMQGRGAYLCPSLGCLGKAWQRKAFRRAFRREVPGLEEATVRRGFEAELQRRGILAA